ncbi:MAG: type II toxin-antitoxin system RelE/ParE family toxin [Campylobacterota bacterium]|nr:type II toxin-antitoxin system RelE/ParE family toxin [Campylobacterota bacterium]
MIEIDYSQTFLKELKKLKKKFKNIDNDLKDFLIELKKNPEIGTPLGHSYHKVRLANSSIPTGKSGGFRIITYLVLNNKIFLVSIFSKTEKENITNQELINAISDIQE